MQEPGGVLNIQAALVICLTGADDLFDEVLTQYAVIVGGLLG